MSAELLAGPSLLTERLLLRRWTSADRAPFAALNADPRVMEHFPAVLDAAASDAMIERIEQGFERNGFGLWAVERRDTGEFIGFVGLSRPSFTADFTSPEHPAVEVGWRLAADAWGHGYASEAAAAALTFGFEQLGLSEIVSFTAQGNERSRRVMERIGMTHAAADDFAHPALPATDRLSAHVLYRATRLPAGATRALPPGSGNRALPPAAATRALPPEWTAPVRG